MRAIHACMQTLTSEATRLLRYDYNYWRLLGATFICLSWHPIRVAPLSIKTFGQLQAPYLEFPSPRNKCFGNVRLVQQALTAQRLISAGRALGPKQPADQTARAFEDRRLGNNHYANAPLLRVLADFNTWNRILALTSQRALVYKLVPCE